MLTLLENGRVLTAAGWLDPGHILIDGHEIADVGAGDAPSLIAERVDLSGLSLLPAFIDLHVHGGGGFSLATRDPEEVRSYARWALSHGAAGFLATIVAGSAEEALECVRAAAEVVGPVNGGAELLGLNLEGPFVSPERPGALPKSWLRRPDAALLREFVRASSGTLRLMTVAPELEGSEPVLAQARAEGFVVSVGHSDAGYEAAHHAFAAGASHVTHAFNAMRPLHHRDPGIIGAALDSPGVAVEVIADGVHLHPATVRLLVSGFGDSRMALITDAVPPAGLPSGTFRLGGQEARLQDGRMLLPDGTIAGSAATMDQVVRNVVKWGIADLASASRMASLVPARVLGVEDRKGRIEPGYDADLVALDKDLHVKMAWAGGIGNAAASV